MRRVGRRAGADKRALHLDPEWAAKMGCQENGRRSAHPPDSGAAPMQPPKTAVEVRDAFGSAMAPVHAGQMDPKIASTLAYLATSWLRAAEVSDLERRIEEIETVQRRSKAGVV